MKLRPRHISVALLLGAVTAIAAPDTGATAPAAGAGPAKKSAAANLTPAEMADQAKAIGTDLTADYRYILSLREVAKKEKDVIKLNCVNDKLVQVKAQLNLADMQQVTLKNELDTKGTGLVAAFDGLTSIRNDVKQLREEANGCLGEPELYKQEAGVEVQKPDIPDDPTVIDPYGAPEGGVVEPPGYASPFN